MVLVLCCLSGLFLWRLCGVGEELVGLVWVGCMWMVLTFFFFVVGCCVVCGVSYVSLWVCVLWFLGVYCSFYVFFAVSVPFVIFVLFCCFLLLI